MCFNDVDQGQDTCRYDHLRLAHVIEIVGHSIFKERGFQVNVPNHLKCFRYEGMMLSV